MQMLVSFLSAGYEVFSEGLNPEVNSPLEARVCGGRVRVTTIEIWEYTHIEERLIPFLRGEALDFEVSGKPDLVVRSWWSKTAWFCGAHADFFLSITHSLIYD